jgi:H+/Cl- antiporter ClcA
MRILASILAGFALAALLVGTGFEWLLDRAAGACSDECAAWRHWLVVVITLTAWVTASAAVFGVWERIKPREAPSAIEENIRRLRRGGW